MDTVVVDGDIDQAVLAPILARVDGGVRRIRVHRLDGAEDFHHGWDQGHIDIHSRSNLVQVGASGEQ